MTPDQFVTDAIRTESRIEKVTINPGVFQDLKAALVGLGNVLDQIKKNSFYKKPFKHTDIQTDLLAGSVYSANIEKNLWTSWIDPLTLEARNVEVAVNPRLFHSIVGIVTEAVELLEALDLNKSALDTVNLREEFGDLLWYIAIGVDETGGDFEGVMERVIAKLRARFPEKFNSEHAINRDLVKERAMLRA